MNGKKLSLHYKKVNSEGYHSPYKFKKVVSLQSIVLKNLITNNY